jgi:O-antigen biosynthesis protein
MVKMPKKPSVCIATADIVGPIQNGGIGTAYYSLAIELADAGLDVTLLYGLGRHSERQPIEHWVRFYRDRKIRFIPVPFDRGPQLNASMIVRSSYSVYQWLKNRRFDVIHFHEWRGIGFFSLLAKQQGLGLKGSLVCVGVHSPTLWAREGMNELIPSCEELEIDHMERECVRLADIVWSPSRYMVQWMKERGWKLPAGIMVRPNICVERPIQASPKKPEIEKIRELVFFGRLEARKGLDIFCHALDLMQRQGTPACSITFLGKKSAMDGVGSAEYIERRSAKWQFPWSIKDDLDRSSAIDYLKEPGKLAVIPSRVDNLPYTIMECLGNGIRFLASDVGGIPEMVAPASRPYVLCPMRPSVFAERLDHILTAGAHKARFAIDPFKTTQEWITWHETRSRVSGRAKNNARVIKTQRKPLVSVCITHHNRPAFLKQALKSISNQDYKPVEVIVVDDSDQPEVTNAVKRLTARFKERGWKYIHQQDRFIGAARNTAARNATGKYLLFMDDDNIAMPKEVSTFVHAITHSGADILSCFLQPFRGLKIPRGRAKMPMWPFLGGSFGAGLFKNVIGDANAFMKRDAYLKCGGYSEDEFLGFDDYEFMTKAVVKGFTVEVLPQALVWYRLHASAMKIQYSNLAEHARALRPYLERVPQELRGILQLAKKQFLQLENRVIVDSAPNAFDDVKDVVIFGAARGGELAMDLAKRCGWRVRYFVDNNEHLWNNKFHDIAVKKPSCLKARDFDLILVASTAAKDALFKQLTEMGFSHGLNYIFFLERISVGGFQMQLSI